MPAVSPDPTRVAVYIDFDNVVISRYDRVFDQGSWRSDGARNHAADARSDDPIAVRLAQAQVEIGALLDYAASFGSIALARAYADWSVPANAAYRRQLVDRAVDLTQLFAVGGTKNGADIRLAVDAVEDLFQYDDLTHVVLVAGDSDYVALAQRIKQLGRYVVGIGVAGSTGRALVAACDEFSDYEALPGLPPAPKKAPAKKAASRRTTKKAAPAPDPEPASGTSDETSGEPETEPDADPQDLASDLLIRAMRIAMERGDDEWLNGGGVKSQMQRMDPGFKEKALGYSSFTDFVKSRAEFVEHRMAGQQLQVRFVE